MTYAAGIPTLVIQAMHESHTMQLKAEKLERITEVVANMSRQLLSRSAEGTEISWQDVRERLTRERLKGLEDPSSEQFQLYDTDGLKRKAAAQLGLMCVSIVTRLKEAWPLFMLTQIHPKTHDEMMLAERLLFEILEAKDAIWESMTKLEMDLKNDGGFSMPASLAKEKDNDRQLLFYERELRKHLEQLDRT
ncbi:hypothetical protein GTA08_BOTSDO09827 [Botryosphaeria dothidea]|uniref:Uncharacterized protein n=1 Tax=Botryosphaeria dothidea TaxID=55169 RepID=A0A8H4IJD3_9PEZI|nr:hypothetical protein GTA08_BOTSDO09827 [Botryosphaeria dothidea]